MKKQTGGDPATEPTEDSPDNVAAAAVPEALPADGNDTTPELPPPSPEMPQAGGSYIRQADGTLVRQED